MITESLRDLLLHLVMTASDVFCVAVHKDGVTVVTEIAGEEIEFSSESDKRETALADALLRYQIAIGKAETVPPPDQSPANLTKQSTPEQRAQWHREASDNANCYGWPGAMESANRILVLLRDIRDAKDHLAAAQATIAALTPGEGAYPPPGRLWIEVETRPGTRPRKDYVCVTFSDGETASVPESSIVRRG